MDASTGSAARGRATVDVDRPYVRPAIPPWVDLRLDANEGPLPDATLTAALGALDPDALRRYPDTVELEREWAAFLGVAPERLVATAGADDAIDRLCRAALGGHGGEVILPMPSFEMFERYTHLAGGVVRRVEWGEESWPRREVLDTIGPDTRLVVVVSPNNPTGSVASLEDLRAVSAAASEAIVVLDHAYAEFAEEDLTATALELPNVVVLRTTSKAWSLAGLRLGCAVGPRRVIDRLRVCGPPYAVSGLACEIGRAALTAGVDTMRATVRQVREERARLSTLLDELGLRPRRSEANFVLATADDVPFVDRGLQSMGIKVRTWPGHVDLDAAVRVGCPGDPAAFDRLERSLRSLLRPDALLLDMDGVIADEGESYREAIRATLAEFDLDMDRGRIAEMKAAGNANNDWVVTHRLLDEAGIRVDYEEVVERFERYYQGTDGRPGLHEKERLLVDRGGLEALRARLPLGIVTGRPRKDALRFLERFGLVDLFETVVTTDCVARGKPDPEPVFLALERMGLRTAWMVGDTPDDLVAARAAAVLPLGICAPTRSDAVSREGLRAAGAYRVLDALSDLQEMLP